MARTEKIKHSTFIQNTLTYIDKAKPKDLEKIKKEQVIIDKCLNCTKSVCKGKCKF